MTDSTVKLIIGAVLFLHGIAHIGPIATYLWIRARPLDSTGGWLPARSWLSPSLPRSSATAIASILWAVSLVGFVAAALSFWGVMVPGELWRQLGVGSAIISTVGILAFIGTWPLFNTLAALAVNAAVLITQLAMHWPPEAMFGK
jgi:hypothetical protein